MDCTKPPDSISKRRIFWSSLFSARAAFFQLQLLFPLIFPFGDGSIVQVRNVHLLENVSQAARIRGVAPVGMFTIWGIQGLNIPEYDTGSVGHICPDTLGVPLVVSLFVAPRVADIASFS